MFNVEITGTGSCVPENAVSNHRMAEIVDTSDEWIVQMTGISERRISRDQDTTELAYGAASRALRNAGVTPEEVELIIVATVTPENFFPSTACLVQARLGANKATAFDISAACAGFIFASNIATQFIKNGVYQTALVIGAEVISKITDWSDRSTCVLFADGAGAAVLQRGETGIITGFTAADGNGAANLSCPALPLRNIFVEKPREVRNFVVMNGREVFKFAVNMIPECINKVLEGTDYSLDDVKYFISHQANIRILEAAAKKLNINPAKFYVNIDKYGNTSSASIPLALDEMSRKGLLQYGDLIVIAGFGAGFTFGAQLIKWTRQHGCDKGEEK